MVVGQHVDKFTWLLDNVEVRGVVRRWEPMPDGTWARIPDGTDVGTGDSFDIEPDPNFAHLVSYVPGYGAWVQCETYPLTPAVGQINRTVPWPLPMKPEDAAFKVLDPATGATVNLRAGDHVRVVGRWCIDHHPENCVTRTRGLLKVGCCHIEFHPFDWENIRLVPTLSPHQHEEHVVSLAAPLYREVYLGGGKHLANELAGVASKVFIEDTGANFDNLVAANAHIRAPSLPTGFTPDKKLVDHTEDVLVNGTGRSLGRVRTLEVVDDGITVSASVKAPPRRRFDGLALGDVDDPARDHSVFQARYRVWWKPRLVVTGKRGKILARLDVESPSGAVTPFRLAVRNRGPDPVRITRIEVTDDPKQIFTVDATLDRVVPAGGRIDVDGTFSPPQEGSFTAMIRIVSDDPAHPSVALRVAGSHRGHDAGTRITCIEKAASRDLSRVLRAVGGPGWKLTTAEAIRWIESGVRFHVEAPTGDQVQVIVARSSLGRKYLRTVADDDWPNNLLALPTCR